MLYSHCRAVALLTGIAVFAGVFFCTRDDAGGNGPDIVCPSTRLIPFVLPDSLTIWQGGHCCDTIRWSAATGDSVQLRLFIDSEYVDFFNGWTPNDGEYVIQAPLPTDWSASAGLRIQILDCAGNQGWTPAFTFIPDTFATMIVLAPNAQSVWKSGAVPAEEIRWSVGDPRIFGDSVRIELFRRGSLVSTMAKSTPNDGRWRMVRRLDHFWGAGNGFQVRIADTKGYYGWSAPFTIKADSCVTITVTTPDSTTVWRHGQTGVTVVWQTTCADSVRIELWRDDRSIDFLSSWIANTGFFKYKAIVKPSWGQAAGGYQIQIKTKAGNYGFSRPFSMQRDSMQTLTILQPSSETSWRWGQDSLILAWSGSMAGNVRCEMYLRDTLAGELFGWTEADSVLRITGAVLKKAGVYGQLITLKIIDMQGYWGWSDAFRIDTAGSLVVTMPARSSIWLHGDATHTVAWKGWAGDSARADIYKKDSLIGVFAWWQPALAEKLLGDSAISAAWGVGDDYRIRVRGSNGNYGWSGFFSLRADTQPVFSVVYPDSSTFWYADQRVDPVRIAYVAADTLRGDSVRCILFYRSEVMDTLTPWIALDSTLPIWSRLYSKLKPSGDYRVKVIDNAYHHAWSAPFRIGADSLQRLNVIAPFGGVVYHGQKELAVSWRGATADSVVLLLYRGDALVDTFVAWGEDSGRAVRSSPIPPSWGTGNGFLIKVLLAGNGIYGFSDTFAIGADSLKRINVTEPSASTTWLSIDIQFVVRWSGSRADSVVVDIYKKDTYLGVFASCAGSDLDSCIRSAPLPAAWGSGAGFRLRVTDQNGNYGWSEEFEILRSALLPSN